MVLTVTLNPLLERRLSYEKVSLGKSHRCIKDEFTAGGKGINVSRQLNLLGIKNSAFTFIGGGSGKIFRHILSEGQIDFNLVQTKSETRSANLIIDESNNSLTTFFGTNSNVSKEEADEFKQKLDKMIHNSSIIVFSGSSPCEETDDIFPYGIELANRYDKISVLDTYGSHLQNCIEATPTVIHNNTSEVEETFGIQLKTEKEKLDYLDQLYRKGIKLAFLTDGANETYASKFDFHYKIVSPKISVIDSAGSGDAFTAGIVYGLESSLVFDEFSKIAAALGSANAGVWETCSVTKDQMEKYFDRIKVEPVGKKMKIIDDSPNY
ncbi:MAG: 1-phosphofructokinase [Ignavibacteriales bacterium]|nr:1-phosphofructokinase [Ignavibacteriales bacterium]